MLYSCSEMIEWKRCAMARYFYVSHFCRTGLLQQYLTFGGANEKKYFLCFCGNLNGNRSRFYVFPLNYSTLPFFHKL
jgi:hypothetical protein